MERGESTKPRLGGHLPLRPRGVAVSFVSFYFIFEGILPMSFVAILMAQPTISDKQIAGYWMGFGIPTPQLPNPLAPCFLAVTRDLQKK